MKLTIKNTTWRAEKTKIFIVFRGTLKEHNFKCNEVLRFSTARHEKLIEKDLTEIREKEVEYDLGEV